MNPTSQHETITLDAKGLRLGKLATQTASILQGKNRVDFSRNTIAPVHVTIINASRMDLTERRKSDIYQSYSGYPGGRKEETLEHLAKRLGYKEVLKRSIGGMLPKNKLQRLMLRNLTINE